MLSMCTIDRLDQAAALLDTTRLRMLRALAEPASASGLARAMSLPRQRANYHLRVLEQAQLVHLVEERRVRNCTERVFRATARAYLINPEILAELGGRPEDVQDRFSWAYLVAVAGRMIRELARLRSWADQQHKRVATFTFDTQVRLASPEALRQLGEDLAAAFTQVVARSHSETAHEGRWFRVIACAHPSITKSESAAGAEQSDDQHQESKRERIEPQD